MNSKLTSKMTWLQIVLVVAFCFLAAFFCQHNDGLYQQTIYRVDRVQNGKAFKMSIITTISSFSARLPTGSMLVKN